MSIDSVLFFCCKQQTTYEMLISDWSSDVCSSDLAVMRVMESAFDPVYGEAWSLAKLLTLFALPSARIVVAWDGDAPCGFSAARIAGPESEMLLLAVDPARRGRGIGGCLQIGRAHV